MHALVTFLDNGHGLVPFRTVGHRELGAVRAGYSSVSPLAFAALTWNTSGSLSAEHMSHAACLLHEFVLGLVVD